MPEIKIVNDFSFTKFLNENDIYKKYIRIKGQAMEEINESSLINHNQLKIKLNDKSLDNKKLILILKLENKIYHIPVMIDQILEENDYSHTIKKSGQVLCVSERRDYERIEINEKVEYYTIENRIQQFYKGIISDISASGTKLITKQELNTKYPVILNVTFLDLPVDELVGKIVWKEKKDNKFFNGIHFEFKDESAQDKLISGLY